MRTDILGLAALVLFILLMAVAADTVFHARSNPEVPTFQQDPTTKLCFMVTPTHDLTNVPCTPEVIRLVK